jgi:hypothetical protein
MSLLDDEYGEMCVTHRNPADPDVVAVTHQLRHLDSRAETCACWENEGVETDRLGVITRRFSAWAGLR